MQGILRRRKYRHVVKSLPHLLKQRYGPQKFYNPGQVETAVRVLKIKKTVIPAAYAVTCQEDEFLEAFPSLDAMHYQATRRHIAELFSLEEWQLNCKHLTDTFRNPVGVSPESPYLAAGGRTSEHSGDD